MRHTVRPRRGIAMVVVLMALALLALVAGALVSMGANNLTYARTSVGGLQAQQAAEAGARHGDQRVRTSTVGANTAITGSVPGGGNYTVNITVGGNMDPYGMLKDSAGNPQAVPADHYYIMSTGTSVGGTVRRVAWYVKKSETLFGAAAFADDKVTLGKDAKTDTWNSASGPYLTSRVANAGSASIGTNSNQKDAIVIDDTAFVDNYGASAGTADVFVGPNPAPDVIKGGAAGTNYRMQKVMTTPKPMPPIDYTAEGVSAGKIDSDASYLANAVLVPNPPGVDVLALKPGTYDQLELDKVALPLILQPGGTYYVKSLNFGVGDALIIPVSATTKTILKTHQGIDFGSSAVMVNNLAQKPNLLRIESDGNLDLSTDNDSYAVIYAPNKKVTLKKGAGSTDFYGSITAKQVKLEDDAAIHYDRALNSEISTGAGSTTIVSVQHF